MGQNLADDRRGHAAAVLPRLDDRNGDEPRIIRRGVAGEQGVIVPMRVLSGPRLGKLFYFLIIAISIS